MPAYEMENTTTGKIELFFIPSSECPSLGEVIEIEGQDWKRVITQAPFGIVKDTINPHSSRQFVEKTGKMKGSVGDVMDQAKELSEKRKEQSPDGRDKVQDKYFDDWSKKRTGKKHPADDR